MNDRPSGPPDGPDDHDQHMRALLDDAVSDVEPRPALDSIQARTKVTTMDSKRPWLYAAIGAVAATAATIAVVTVVTGDDAPRTTSGPAASDTPSATASEDPSPTEPTEAAEEGEEEPAETAAVPVYYVGDTNVGPRLFREFHQLPVDGSEAAQVSTAVEEALGDTATDPDYRSGWPEGVTVGGVNLDGNDPADLLWIDLSGSGNLQQRPAGMSDSEATMAVQQLVYTAHAVLQRRHPVEFLVDGESVDTLLGVPVAEQAVAGDPMEVQASVWITSPQDGDEVSSPIKVEGRGAFFEANVSWQLLENGQVVDEGFTTAEEGMTLSPYSFEIDAEPGDYVVRVYDADMSGGEGNGEAEDTKRVRVTD